MKFHGKIGFWIDEVETRPGIWESQIIEKDYIGDVIENNRRFVSSESQNDQFSVNNSISIIADLYMKQNWTSIRYVIWDGAKFKVDKVKVSYPRLQLDIGGIYNG